MDKLIEKYADFICSHFGSEHVSDYVYMSIMLRGFAAEQKLGKSGRNDNG